MHVPPLRFHRLRFHFRLRVALDVPPGAAANRVRGGLGRILKQMACPAECQDFPELSPGARLSLWPPV